MKSYTETTIVELKKLLTEENILKFFSIFSITPENFKAESKKYELADELKKYEFNLLRRYPIIKTSSENENEKYIIPSMADLVYGTFEGLYYVLLDKLPEEDKLLLFQELGSIFEEYVGTLIEFYEINKGINFVPEMEYKIGNDRWKGADWTLVSEKYIFQIECKKRKIDNYSRAGLQSEDGAGIESLTEDIAKQLDKLIEKESHIKAGKIAEIEYKGQEVINLIVYLDEMFGMNDHAREKIKSKMKKSSDNFYILGCWVFEMICQQTRNKKQDFYTSLKDFFGGKIDDMYQVDFLSEQYDKFFAEMKK